jgi:formate dehydrogenase subunit delta
MQASPLIRMANQIGRFFESMPGRSEALAGAAQHMKNYWEPRMRRELLAQIDAEGDDGLDAFVAEAITRHRDLLA